MIKLFVLFILPLSLFGSKILSYNIYDRSDRVDVMITFDTPYNGIIKQSITPSTIAIKLQDAQIESSKLKEISSKYLTSLSITPMSDYTKIVAKVPKSIKLQASKTSDSYGLRLRFSVPTDVTKKSTTETEQVSTIAGLPTKKEDDISQSYYIVIAILIIGIVILFYIKNRVSTVNDNKNKQSKQTSSWLFKETSEEKQMNMQNNNEFNSEVTIKFQKSINDTNSVVMLDFAGQGYLVLMGKNNILLDKFIDNKPQTQDDFDSILQNRHKELDDFLKSDSIQNEPKEALQAYKERAASIAYED